MKKFTFLVILTFLVLAFKTTSASTKIIDYLDNTTGIERNTKVTERLTERTIFGKLNDERKSAINELFSRMLTKLNSISVRLENLIEKTQQKLDQTKEDYPKANLNQAQTDLDSAKTKLDGAKVNIDNAKIQLKNIFASENPREEFFELKDLINDIKTDFVEVRKLLVKTVTQIKKVEAIYKK